MSLKQERESLYGDMQYKFQNYFSKSLPNSIAALQLDDRNNLLQEFKRYASRTTYFGLYKSEGFANIIVVDHLIEFLKRLKNNFGLLPLIDDFIREHYPDIGLKIKSLNQAIKQCKNL